MHGLYLFSNLFSDSQLHESGYTQHRDVLFRRGRTLDLDIEAKKMAIFPQFSASDGFQSYFHEL